MNQRQARAIALQIAYASVRGALDAGGAIEWTETNEDAGKVEAELEKIAESLYARWEKAILDR